MVVVVVVMVVVVVVVVVVVCMFVLGRERQTGILQAAPKQILNDWSDGDKSKAAAKAVAAAAAT